MKLRICVFLIKEGIPAGQNIIEINQRPVAFNIDENPCEFYSQRTTSTSKWVRLFNEVAGIDANQMVSSGVQGLLKINAHGRTFCLAFGHARHMINPLLIERYFGLKVALGLTDPDLVKSIDKSSIDRTPMRSRNQATKYISMSGFDFKFDWEILKSLTGVVQRDDNTDNYEIVSGSDAVFLHTDIDLDGIPDLCRRLLDAYENQGYRQNFPWIDRIVVIKDRVLLDDLDRAVINNINNQEYDRVWIAPPLMIDQESFYGFCFKRAKNPVVHPDMSLEQCIREKGMLGRANAENVRSTKILMVDEGHNEIESWPLYICLNANVEINGNLYLLSEGDWYQIDRDFRNEIESYFNNIPRSQVVLPPYNGRSEPIYLTETADGQNLFLMDRKLVRPNGAASGIEFCDLLTRDNHLIHVKKYSASSTLSHLFAQGFVAAESLLRNQDVIDQVNTHLQDQGYNHQFVFNRQAAQRASKIIYAIMHPGAGDLDIPFFSKVNLRQFSMKLVEMGFQVEVAKISIQ